jgi:hypothetical protein
MLTAAEGSCVHSARETKVYPDSVVKLKTPQVRSVSRTPREDTCVVHIHLSLEVVFMR